MAFDKNVPLATNTIAADLLAMNANWEFTSAGVVTTAGDMTYASAAGAMARLAADTANMGLYLNAGNTAPEWGFGNILTEHTYDLTTATGNQTLTGAGFTPSKAVLLYGIDGVAFGVGFSDGAGLDHCLNHSSSYNTAPSYSAITCVTAFTGVSPDYQQATLTFNTDGGVLAWVKTASATGTLNISVLWIR